MDPWTERLSGQCRRRAIALPGLSFLQAGAGWTPVISEPGTRGQTETYTLCLNFFKLNVKTTRRIVKMCSILLPWQTDCVRTWKAWLRFKIFQTPQGSVLTVRTWSYPEPTSPACHPTFPWDGSVDNLALLSLHYFRS